MSEYQHYEFQTLDRPLTEREMADVRRWSTRAEITPTSFVNTYQWGDFKGDPDALVEKYYDVFFYFANWGTRELKFRFPRRSVDVDAMKPYCERRRLEAIARAKYLKNLGKDEAAAWAKVDALIAKRQPQSYDEAVSLLKDLHEVLRATGRASELKARVRRLRDQHAKKGNFLARLDHADLGHG